jgi:hypothetical protein
MTTRQKMTDVVNGKTFFLKIGEETPRTAVMSQLPYIGRELFAQMESEQPKQLAEKMKDPEALVAEMWRLSEVYRMKGDSLINNGMEYTEAMAESRQHVAAMLNL